MSPKPKPITSVLSGVLSKSIVSPSPTPSPARLMEKRSSPARCTAKWSGRRNSRSTPAKSSLLKATLLGQVATSLAEFPFSGPTLTFGSNPDNPSSRHPLLTSKKRGHTVSRTASLSFSEVPHELRNHASRGEAMTETVNYKHAFFSTVLISVVLALGSRSAPPQEKPRTPSDVHDIHVL